MGRSVLVGVDDTGDGDWLPVTTATRLLTGGSGCCGLLKLVTRGAVAPPINMRARTVVLSREAWSYVSGLCTLGRDQLKSCRCPGHCF